MHSKMFVWCLKMQLIRSSWVRTEAAAAGDNSSGSNNSNGGHDSSISALGVPSGTPPITGSISRRPRLPPVPPSALTSSNTANAGQPK